MQSDGNSFCGDVVSGSFNKINKDEDTFSDLYAIKYVRIIIMMILIPYNIIRKCAWNQLYDFVVVMSCMSFDKHIFPSLLKF